MRTKLTQCFMTEYSTMRGTAIFWEITRVKEEDNLLILIVHIKHSDPEGVLPIGETKEA